jgi:hypothetical protein
MGCVHRGRRWECSVRGRERVVLKGGRGTLHGRMQGRCNIGRMKRDVPCRVGKRCCTLEDKERGCCIIGGGKERFCIYRKSGKGWVTGRKKGKCYRKTE